MSILERLFSTSYEDTLRHAYWHLKRQEERARTRVQLGLPITTEEQERLNSLDAAMRILAHLIPSYGLGA